MTNGEEWADEVFASWDKARGKAASRVGNFFSFASLDFSVGGLRTSSSKLYGKLDRLLPSPPRSPVRPIAERATSALDRTPMGQEAVNQLWRRTQAVAAVATTIGQGASKVRGAIGFVWGINRSLRKRAASQVAWIANPFAGEFDPKR